MHARTEIEPLSTGVQIDHSSKILLLGSCFSDAIGSRLSRLKFNELVNPFGVVFNPESISSLLNFSPVEDAKIVQREDVFLYYDYHSEIHGYSKEALIENIKSQQSLTKSFLHDATHVFITLGTSWVFDFKGAIVNNCHKQASSKFERRLMSVDEIERSLANTVHRIKSLNPSIEIVFTVSPVRHVKNGLQGNNRSKARLLVALEQFSNQDKVSYFPSYEIVLDDLRDYQFFEADGIHPNKTAEDYVFEQFSKAYFSDKTNQLNQKINALLMREQHKGQFKKSKAWLAFQEKLKNDITDFSAAHPIITWHKKDRQ